MTLHSYLEDSAARYPHKVGLVCGERNYTYQELLIASSAFAGELRTRGLRKGNRVLIYLENSPELVTAVFGTLFAGGCIVVVNPASTLERFRTITGSCGATFIVTPAERREEVQAATLGLDVHPHIICTLSENCSDIFFDFGDAGDDASRGLAPGHLSDDDLAAIIYTSGSTGQPKGVTMLHRNLDAAVTSIDRYLGHSADDVILNILPLSSSYGMLQLLTTVRAGARFVLEKGLGFPFDFIRLLQRESITGFAGTPTVFAILLKLNNLADEEFPSLRYITNAAAALPPSFVPRLAEVFPRTKLFLMHGLSECIRTTYLSPDEVMQKPTSVGRGMPNVELWLEDDLGKRVHPGDVGELIVRSPAVMQGYWNDPELSRTVLRKGRNPSENILRTGDLFTMDEEGYYYFLSRKDQIIKTRGEKVSPVEVEHVIYQIDGVLEARALPLPDEILGQAICVEIVLADNAHLEEAEVRLYCKRMLEDFKVPKVIRFVSSLPKTTGGKIVRSHS